MAAGALLSGTTAAWVGQPPQPASVASPLVLGLLLPPEEPEAASIREGALLAVEEANRSSGLPVRLIVRGRTGPWGSDASEAALLVTEDGATGLIGPTEGTACHLLLQVAGRTHVPVVLLCPEASLTRAAVPWVARVVPRTLDEARALFSGIDPRTRAGRPRWAVFVGAGREGREAAADIAAAAAEAGCSITPAVHVGARIPDASELQALLSRDRPDAVLLWLDPRPAGRLASRLRLAGFAGRFAGPGRLRSTEFAAEAGIALERVVVSEPEDMSSEALRHFEAAFLSRFGRVPGRTAALAHDAASLLVASLRSATRAEPARLKVPPRTPWRGITGNLVFDRNGNRMSRLQLTSAHGGSFLPLPPPAWQPTGSRATGRGPAEDREAEP